MNGNAAQEFTPEAAAALHRAFLSKPVYKVLVWLSSPRRSEKCGSLSICLKQKQCCTWIRAVRSTVFLEMYQRNKGLNDWDRSFQTEFLLMIRPPWKIFWPTLFIREQSVEKEVLKMDGIYMNTILIISFPYYMHWGNTSRLQKGRKRPCRHVDRTFWFFWNFLPKTQVFKCDKF